MNQCNTNRRRAFSLLELMIALVLLGVLSALAWSILDNFRNAEQRGWRVASRLQSIRSARLWLEEDLLHVCETLPTSSPNSSSRSSPISFQGTSTGFSITYAPSIDPLPWLEELVLNRPDSATQEPAALNRYTRLGLYNVAANYQLQNGGSLTRTITSQAPLAPRESNATSTTDIEVAEPTLTVSDLYRQSDRIDQIGQTSAALNQSQLGPLYRPRFRYHDGSTWKTTWTASASISLPAAIELSYDLDDAASTLSEGSESTTPSADTSADLPDPLDEVEVPVVELDDDVSEAMLQEPRQIRIVVRLPWVQVSPSSSSSTMMDENETFGTRPSNQSTFPEESVE